MFRVVNKIFIIALIAVASIAYAGSYTPNLNLYKPDVHEMNWGQSIDTDLDLIDAGYASLVAGWVLSSSQSTTLNTALISLGSKTTNYFLDAASKLSGDATTPNTLNIMGSINGLITLNSHTLSIPGSFSAGEFQVFALPGLVTSLRTVKPEWFGAKGDGVTDDSAAIQAAFNSLDKAWGGEIDFSHRHRYYVKYAVNLPKQTAGKTAIFQVEGNGAELYTDQTITILQLIPISNTEANQIVGAKFIIKNMLFTGTSVTGQGGVSLGATYGSVFENCHFSYLDTGLDIQFGLKNRVINCFGLNNLTDSFVFRSGYWSGATINNSQSNMSTVDSARVYNKAGAFSSFKILSTNEVTLRDIIIEGNGPQYGVYFDSLFSTTVKNITIDGAHVECAPSIVTFKIKGTGGIAVIKKLYQSIASLVIDNSEGYSTPAYIHVEDVAYLPGGVMFKDGSNASQFVFFGTGNTSLLSSLAVNKSYWYNGTINGSAVVIGNNGPGGPGAGLYAAGNGSNFYIASDVSTKISGSVDSYIYGGAAGTTYIRVHNSGSIYHFGTTQLNGNLTWNGTAGSTAFRVTDSSAISTATPTTTARKWPIYDSSGSLLGYVPIFTTIP